MNNKSLFALFVITLQFIPGGLISQWIEWEKRTVYTDHEIRCFSVKQSVDGNILASGYRSPDNGYIYKASQSGDSLWICNNAKGYSIAEDNNGNIFSVYENLLYKVSPGGVLLWQKNLSDSIFLNTSIFKIIKSSDNMLIIAGYTLYNGLGSGFIGKYDLNGNKIWSNAVNSSGRSYSFHNLSQLSDGSYSAFGNVSISNIKRLFMVKFNTGGQIIMNKIFGYSNSYNKSSGSIFQLSDKSYLAFYELGYGTGDSRLVITKMDSTGNFSWRKFYGDTNRLYHLWYGEGIIKDKFRNLYLVTGSRQRFLTPPYDTNFCSLSAYDSLGNLIWEKFTYSDSFPSYVNGLTQNNDSSYIVCGDAFKNFSSGYSASPKYLYLLKTKKINPIGIYSISSNIPSGFRLHQNYPNPFNPVTRIKFELPKAGQIEFAVYDILGRKLYTEFFTKRAGSYELEFNGSEYSSGVYFYSVSAGEFKETRKMIIIK